MKAKIRILTVLARAGREMTGLEIARTDKKLSMGTIYIHLSELEHSGDVTVRVESTEELLKRFREAQVENWALPRRFYKISPGGRRRLMEQGITGPVNNPGLQGA